jgi:ABC-type antimicrobial peptide transport system permease subunit
MALGARRHHVLKSVLSQVFLLVMAGVTVGAGLSLLINLIIRPFVYGVTFNDPLTISLATAVMLLVAGVAGYLPARRATLVDPTIALRHE